MASKGLILVADDSADDIFLLSHAFNQSGLDCSLATVRDGEEAIAYLCKETPDLLLLDLKMPKVNGFDVLQWIRGRSNLCDLPVVVLSSSMLHVDRNRAMQLGATDYLVKTGDLKKLEAMFRSLHSRFLGICK